MEEQKDLSTGKRRPGHRVLVGGWTFAVIACVLGGIGMALATQEARTQQQTDVRNLCMAIGTVLVWAALLCGLISLFYRRWMAAPILVLATIVLWFASTLSVGAIGLTLGLMDAFGSKGEAAARSALMQETQREAQMQAIYLSPPVPEQEKCTGSAAGVASSDLALMLLVEKSGYLAEKSATADRAVLEAINSLNDDDCAAVVGFGKNLSVLVDLQTARGAKTVAESAIAKSKAEGKSYLLPAFRLAREKLSTAATRKRHVVVITTGKFPLQSDPWIEEIELYKKNRITASVIALGSNPDMPILQLLARQLQGSFYEAAAADLSDILLGEITKQRARTGPE